MEVMELCRIKHELSCMRKAASIYILFFPLKKAQLKWSVGKQSMCGPKAVSGESIAVKWWTAK